MATTYVRTFAVENVGDIHLKFVRLMTLMLQAGPAGAVSLQRTERAYADFKRQLNAASRRGARVAQEDMRMLERATRVRVSTGRAPGLSNYLTARMLRADSGAVGVAPLEVLERARNPGTPGYGSYWRAQEYGTGAPAPGMPPVPTQIGRVLRGYFYDPGYSNPTVPMSIYKGTHGPHPLFAPGNPKAGGPGDFGKARLRGGPGPRGGRGAMGIIEHEIKGRHFIRDGANSAERVWLAEIYAVQQRALVELASVLP